MAGSRPADGTLGEVLASRRRRTFVGREGELELVRAALVADEPSFSVLWFTGPAGIGKTSLLAVIAEQAADAGWRVVRLDGREPSSSPRRALDVVQAAVGAPAGGEAPAAAASRLLLVCSTPTCAGAAPPATSSSSAAWATMPSPPSHPRAGASSCGRCST
jgi:hypothetical protein